MLLKIKTRFITSFKVQKKSGDNGRRVTLKNTLLVHFFRVFFTNKSYSVFYLPSTRKKFSVLNAPYRYKLSQTSVGFTKYCIILTKNVHLSSHSHKSLLSIINLVKFLIHSSPIFETNVIHITSINYFINYYELKNFYLNNGNKQI